MVKILAVFCSLLSLYAVCVYLFFYDLFFLVGCVGLVGISLASRVTYVFAFVSLSCVEFRAGTSIFGPSAGVGGGTVRIFCLLGFILVCVV